MKSVLVPQADRLDKIRTVLEAIRDGAATPRLLEQVTGISARHIGYTLAAARILGLVAEEETGPRALRITAEGSRLLQTGQGTRREAARWRQVIERNESIRRLAPQLLDQKGPTTEELTRRIQELTNLSPATARRRAQALISWRACIREAEDPAMSLFTGPEEEPPAPRREPRHEPAPPSPVGGLYLRAIQARNYGLLREVAVPLRPFSVMIGRNATGKSTTMDTVALIADCLEKDVTGAVGRRASTLDDLLWYGEGEAFELAFEFLLPVDLPREQGLDIARYEVGIGRLAEGGVGVTFERLYLRPGGAIPSGIYHEDTPKGWIRVLSLGESGVAFYSAERKGQTWKTVFHLGAQKLALSNLPQDLKRLPVANRVRDFFLRGVQRLALHPAEMTQACSPLKKRSFLPDGSNLPLVVQHLAARAPSRFQHWLDHLREALPELTDVRVVEREEDRHLYLKVVYRGGLQLPAWRLSEGTLRIIALTLIPFAAEADSVFLIEEPENGIHPRALEAVYQALRLSQEAQVLVASHSTVFIGIVRPDDLLCFSRDGGHTRIIPGTEHPALTAWQGKMDLGTLFAASVLE